MSVWLWVLIAFGAFGVVFLLAMAVPLDFRFRFVRGTRSESSVRIEWLFGLVGRDITTPPSARRNPRADEKEDPHEPGPGPLAVWRSGMIQRGVRLLLKLRKAVSIREFRVRASINAGDPAETGMAFAVIGPLVGAAALLRRADIAIEPDFGDEAGVRGELRGWVRVIPVVGLPSLVRFALSPATWRGLRMLRKADRA